MPVSSIPLSTDSVSFHLILLGPLLEYVFPCIPLLRALLGNMRGYVFLLTYRKPSIIVCISATIIGDLTLRAYTRVRVLQLLCRVSSMTARSFLEFAGGTALVVHSSPMYFKEIKVKPKSLPSTVSRYYVVDVSLASERGSQMS